MKTYAARSKSNNRPSPSTVIDGYRSPPDSSNKLDQHILTYEFQMAEISFSHQNQSVLNKSPIQGQVPAIHLFRVAVHLISGHFEKSLHNTRNAS